MWYGVFIKKVAHCVVLLVREKCKDIVALLCDDETLSEARRTKRPPFDRRPSSTGPLTIASASRRPSNFHQQQQENDDIALPLKARSASIHSRRSFEELQDIDEETAMKMAMAESKAEFESATQAKRDRYTIIATMPYFTLAVC